MPDPAIEPGTVVPAPTAPEPERTFTQAELDRVVGERLARAKSTPPADYDDLKAKASRLDELEAASQTELEKANAARTKAESEAVEATARAKKALTDAALLAAAAGKFADPTDALALVDRSALEFDRDDGPINAADLVTSLLESKPHLRAGSTGGPRGDADQGARGGSGNQITREALKSMSTSEILQAQKEGLLDVILGRAR